MTPRQPKSMRLQMNRSFARWYYPVLLRLLILALLLSPQLLQAQENPLALNTANGDLTVSQTPVPVKYAYATVEPSPDGPTKGKICVLLTAEPVPLNRLNQTPVLAELKPTQRPYIYFEINETSQVHYHEIFDPSVHKEPVNTTSLEKNLQIGKAMLEGQILTGAQNPEDPQLQAHFKANLMKKPGGVFELEGMTMQSDAPTPQAPSNAPEDADIQTVEDTTSPPEIENNNAEPNVASTPPAPEPMESPETMTSPDSMDSPQTAPPAPPQEVTGKNSKPESETSRQTASLPPATNEGLAQDAASALEKADASQVGSSSQVVVKDPTDQNLWGLFSTFSTKAKNADFTGQELASMVQDPGHMGQQFAKQHGQIKDVSFTGTGTALSPTKKTLELSGTHRFSNRPAKGTAVFVKDGELWKIQDVSWSTSQQQPPLPQ